MIKIKIIKSKESKEELVDFKNLATGTYAVRHCKTREEKIIVWCFGSGIVIEKETIFNDRGEAISNYEHSEDCMNNYFNEEKYFMIGKVENLNIEAELK